MLDEPVLPDIYEAELGIPEIRPIIIEMPTEPTQTTVANPIVCWFPALYDWVEVTWTPPGQEWPKERIELSGLPSYMLVHYDNPSEELIEQFRNYWEITQWDRMSCWRDSVMCKIYEEHLSFVSAWLAIYDPPLDHA